MSIWGKRRQPQAARYGFNLRASRVHHRTDGNTDPIKAKPAVEERRYTPIRPPVNSVGDGKEKV
jgi:hypothetical protein